MDHATFIKMLGAAGLVSIVLGGLGAMLPWKARRMSTASIQRRVYWTGTAASTLLLFISQWPDWRSGMIIAFAVAFVMVGSAWRFTSHLKIGEKIYAATRYHRRPDPPPALARNGD